jgi:hypothetical protein
MIKLSRPAAPTCLSPTEVARLTQEYATTGNPVWNRNAIKEALLETSHNKCAYCEAKIDIESKYLEVEHFLYKNNYPNLVVQWENLLPSCKRCNGKKGTHDVSVEPIINPYDDDPRDHIELKWYRIRPRTAVGSSSIGVLDLNNQPRAVLARYEIGEKIVALVERCIELLSKYNHTPDTKNLNALVGVTEGLLLECQATAAYSATSATVLHDQPEYVGLVEAMRRDGLWSDELEALHVASASLTLQPV